MKEEINEKPRFVSPQSVLKEVELQEGDVVIDYGASSGHWVIPAALIVGPKGQVLAIDNDIQILNIIKGSAKLRGLQNVILQELNFEKEDPKFESKADLIIVANILHLIKDKEKFIQRISKFLKDDGKMIVVEWTSERKFFGPPEELRLKEEKVISLFEQIGLRFVCIVDAGCHHFGLVFDKGHSHAKRKESIAK